MHIVTLNEIGSKKMRLSEKRKCKLDIALKLNRNLISIISYSQLLCSNVDRVLMLESVSARHIELLCVNTRHWKRHWYAAMHTEEYIGSVRCADVLHLFIPVHEVQSNKRIKCFQSLLSLLWPFIHFSISFRSLLFFNVNFSLCAANNRKICAYQVYSSVWIRNQRVKAK